MSGKVERCGYQVWHSTDETGDAFTFARHLMLIKREGMCTYIPKEIYLDMDDEAFKFYMDRQFARALEAQRKREWGSYDPL